MDKFSTEKYKKLLELLDNFRLLPIDLLKIILNYYQGILWNSKPKEILKFPGWPCGLTTNELSLYVASYNNRAIFTYDLSGQIKERTPFGDSPWALQFYQNEFYLVGKLRFYILDFKKEIITQWDLPTKGSARRGLKVDNQGTIYVTIRELDSIYVYNRKGELKNEIKGKNDTTFSDPAGMDCDDTFLYICDCHKDRIQILNKSNYQYYSQWKVIEGRKFSYPYSIYLDLDIVYVGDKRYVYIFTTEGKFLQEIGNENTGLENDQFRDIHGICIIKEHLYIGDWQNGRIKIFGRESQEA